MEKGLQSTVNNIPKALRRLCSGLEAGMLELVGTSSFQTGLIRYTVFEHRFEGLMK